MTTPFAPKKVSVCLVAVPEVATGVMHGMYEVFSYVGGGWEALTGWPPSPGRFLPRIVAASRDPFRNMVGLPVAPELSFDEAKRADIVIVADLAIDRDEETRGRWPAEAAWLRAQHAQGALVCSVCTGSLMLAEAGLLDGEEATCHWAAIDQLRRRYPAITLRPERVLVLPGATPRGPTSSSTWSPASAAKRRHGAPQSCFCSGTGRAGNFHLRPASAPASTMTPLSPPPRNGSSTTTHRPTRSRA
jgi:putative intracellular protease/amidase